MIILRGKGKKWLDKDGIQNSFVSNMTRQQRKCNQKIQRTERKGHFAHFTDNFSETYCTSFGRENFVNKCPRLRLFNFPICSLILKTWLVSLSFLTSAESFVE